MHILTRGVSSVYYIQPACKNCSWPEVLDRAGKVRILSSRHAWTQGHKGAHPLPRSTATSCPLPPPPPLLLPSSSYRYRSSVALSPVANIAGDEGLLSTTERDIPSLADRSSVAVSQELVVSITESGIPITLRSSVDVSRLVGGG